MRWRLLIVYIVLLLSALAWSCGDYSLYPEIKDNRIKLTPENLQLLLDAEWQLYSFEERAEPIMIQAGQIFTLSFRETEAVGRADRNLYSVSYEKDSTGRVRFLTVKTSGIPTLPESFDRRFFEALRDAHSFTTTDNVLRIFYESDYVMNFIRRPYTSLRSFNQLQNKQWRLRSFETAGVWVSDSTKVTIVPDDQIFTLFVQDSTHFSGRSDCNRYTGELVHTPSPTNELHNVEFQTTKLYSVPDDVYCNVGSMDNTYRSALAMASHYDITDSSLHIYYDNNKKVMHFALDTTTYVDGLTLDSFVGTSWQLTGLFKFKAPLPFSDRKVYTLNIAADSLYGQASCKEYALRYRLYPSSMIAVTLVRQIQGDCSESTDGEKSFHNHFLKAISSLQRYTFTDKNTLLLYNPEQGGYRLVFVRK